MANVVLLFGHGSFAPDEAPGKATVPGGCRFCLFARHGEEIDGTRMKHLSYYLGRYNVDALAQQADLLGHADFMDEMKQGQHLRRIKTAGDQVHNYRLFPPSGLQYDLYGEQAETGVKLVTVDEEHGVTLAQLFERHGTPGSILMWVACRAIVGQVRHGIDGYDLPPSVTEVARTDGEGMMPVYRRTDGYFKG